jgi:hypothetical protein
MTDDKQFQGSKKTWMAPFLSRPGGRGTVTRIMRHRPQARRGTSATAASQDLPLVVLPGDNVFDVESEERVVVLMHPAVFTAIAGASTDLAARGGVHWACLASSSRA